MHETSQSLSSLGSRMEAFIIYQTKSFGKKQTYKGMPGSLNNWGMCPGWGVRKQLFDRKEFFFVLRFSEIPSCFTISMAYILTFGEQRPCICHDTPSAIKFYILFLHQNQTRQGVIFKRVKFWRKMGEKYILLEWKWGLVWANLMLERLPWHGG